MNAIEHELDRCLTLLRNKIRARSFTQLEVQESLHWGRSYISQLLTQQKALRMDQVLRILDVIGVEPASFFGELYGASDPARPEGIPRPDPGAGPGVDELRSEIGELRTFLRGVVFALVEEKVLSEEDLVRALEVTREDSARGDAEAGPGWAPPE